MVACTGNQGMMESNSVLGMSRWGTAPILVGIGFVILLGFVIWLGVTKRNR